MVETAVVDTSSKYTGGVAVGVAVGSVVAVVTTVGSGVGVAGVSASAGDVIGVPASSGRSGTPVSVAAKVVFPAEDDASVPRCMKAVISGGRRGAANPTTKSAMHATTPSPIRPLKIRSSFIAP